MMKEGTVMKKLSYLFATLALVLSHAMCIVVAWNYRDMLCGIAHSCYSAPAWAAYLHVIPFGIGIVICVVLALHFRGKK